MKNVDQKLVTKLYDLLMGANMAYSTDTRTIRQGDVFFALKGENFNGNEYAAQALNAGARIVVADDAGVLGDLADNDAVEMVADAKEMFKAIARHHRRQFAIPVVGIGGSNGKTTTKELIRSIITRSHTALITDANDNNEIGVAKTLLRLNTSHEFAIIEVGTNTPGELAKVVDICEPTHGLVTNIGKEHLEFLGDIQGVIQEECALFDALALKKDAVFFVPTIDQNVATILESLKLKNQVVISYGDAKPSDVIVREFEGETESEKPMTIAVNWDDYLIPTNLFGEFNVQNIQAAIAVCVRLGIDSEDVVRGLREYMPDNHRSQIVECSNDNTVIFDCYNSNPGSVPGVLDAFNRLESDKEKVVILGDMLEMGATSATEHQTIVDQLVRDEITLAENVYLVGPDFAQTNGASHGYNLQASPLDFAEFLKTKPFTNKLILIKASKGIFYVNGIHRLLD